MVAQIFNPSEFKASLVYEANSKTIQGYTEKQCLIKQTNKQTNIWKNKNRPNTNQIISKNYKNQSRNE